MSSCPACSQTIASGDRYCEACGTRLDLVSPADAPEGARPDGCRRCPDGTVTDGYCDTCGMAPEPENAHQSTDLTAWLGGCCDVGRRRPHNQDALALARTGPDAGTALLVVCDGVSSSPGSDQAAGAAAQAALDALLTDPEDLRAAVTAAGRAAAGLTPDTDDTGEATDGHGDSPATTLALAVLHPGADGTARVATANVGDSRVYWLPDDPDSPALHLGADDSVAAELIAAGMPEAEAAAGPGAHAITAWLGRDAPTPNPNLDDCRATGPGWLLVCSDGLWNYFPGPDELRALVHTVHDDLADATVPSHLADSGRATVRAVQMARQLVARANEAGGRDNITVALARWTPPPAEGPDVTGSSSEGSRP